MTISKDIGIPEWCNTAVTHYRESSVLSILYIIATYLYLQCTCTNLYSILIRSSFSQGGLGGGMLKDHMRKKQHKKINPQNKVYDRFYVINLLPEAGQKLGAGTV